MPGNWSVCALKVSSQKHALPFRISLSSLAIEWRITRSDFRSFIVRLESIKEAKCDLVCKVLGETESATIVHTLVLQGKLSCMAVGVNPEVGPNKPGGRGFWPRMS